MFRFDLLHSFITFVSALNSMNEQKECMEFSKKSVDPPKLFLDLQNLPRKTLAIVPDHNPCVSVGSHEIHPSKLSHVAQAFPVDCISVIAHCRGRIPVFSHSERAWWPQSIWKLAKIIKECSVVLIDGQHEYLCSECVLYE